MKPSEVKPSEVKPSEVKPSEVKPSEMKHLTETEIADWVTGLHTPAILRHVEDCPECRERARTLASALQLFRESAREWADNRTPPVRMISAQRLKPWAVRWAVAAVALALLVSVPVYDSYRRDRQARAETALAARQAAEEAEDAALLSQVDTGVSRAVPAPLEPLVSLVSWNSGSWNASAGQ